MSLASAVQVFHTDAPLNAGVAIHSLRAAKPESIRELTTRCTDTNMPIHVHVAEQTAEVDECLAVTGLRPVEWLLQHGALDAQWQLVHATHVTSDEVVGVQATGAAVVLCPSTEANLGDGLTEVAGWLDVGTTLCIGSDSHVTRDWREELRVLEYGQRLVHRQRNVAASPANNPSTASRLTSRMISGGSRAAGYQQWGIAVGARADAVLLRTESSELLGMPLANVIDATVFSSPAKPFSNVMVAGRWALTDGHHQRETSIGSAFVDAMKALHY